MAKIKLGSVVEIALSDGLVYGQYTHQHKRYGALIRVLKQVHHERPASFTDLVRGEELFRAVFIPLAAGVKKGIWHIVAEEEIPDDRRQFPLFRAGALKPGQKKVDDWWLWDGEKEWRVGSLTEEQKKLPMRGVYNDTALVQLIENGGYFDWCTP